jgi:hypothetical protein
MERPITCRIACVKMVPGEVVPGTSAPPPPRDPVKRYQGPTRLGGAPTLTKAPESGGDPARGAPPSPHRGPGVGGPPGPHGAGSGAGPPLPGILTTSGAGRGQMGAGLRSLPASCCNHEVIDTGRLRRPELQHSLHAPRRL